MFKLILEFQDTVVDDYIFHKIPVTIGRRDDNDVVIDNMAVSGHHAVIEAEDPNYFVLVDLDSLNGTFLNERKIGRERVFHGDTIIVGKHRLRLEDLRPERERPSREEVEEEKSPPGPAFRDTVILETKAQEELLAKQAEKMGYSPDEIPEKSKRLEFLGSLTITSGGTPQIVDLSKRVTTLGKSSDADVKCSGFFVGKVGALINKRPNGFFLSHAEGFKKPEVNGEQVTTQVQLNDGDEVVLGNTRMTFNLSEASE